MLYFRYSFNLNVHLGLINEAEASQQRWLFYLDSWRALSNSRCFSDRSNIKTVFLQRTNSMTRASDWTTWIRRDVKVWMLTLLIGSQERPSTAAVTVSAERKDKGPLGHSTPSRSRVNPPTQERHAAAALWVQILSCCRNCLTDWSACYTTFFFFGKRVWCYHWCRSECLAWLKSEKWGWP